MIKNILEKDIERTIWNWSTCIYSYTCTRHKFNCSGLQIHDTQILYHLHQNAIKISLTVPPAFIPLNTFLLPVPSFARTA